MAVNSLTGLKTAATDPALLGPPAPADNNAPGFGGGPAMNPGGVQTGFSDTNMSAPLGGHPAIDGGPTGMPGPAFQGGPTMAPPPSPMFGGGPAMAPPPPAFGGGPAMAPPPGTGLPPMPPTPAGHPAPVHPPAFEGGPAQNPHAFHSLYPGRRMTSARGLRSAL